MKKVYLDNNATTAVDPRVADAIFRDLKDNVGNPSSIHSYGQQARQKLNKARETIAAYLNVEPDEIIFTSGGTEGANLILRGLFPANARGHIITSNLEHSCVYSTIRSLETQGVSCTYLESGLWGAPTPEAVAQSLRGDTALIALMAVNNETGVRTDIDAIAAIALEAKIPFFVDAVALFGKESFSIPDGVSYMICSGHKIHAPKGVGFSLIRGNAKLKPFLVGGEQEFGLRAGTENMPGIVGLAAAVDILRSELPEGSERMRNLRNRLEEGIMAKVSGVSINGLGPRVSNTTNLSFEGMEGETLLAALDLEGVAVSHGSACASGALEPSRVLLNMGLSKESAGTSLRFSLSRFTTEEDIDFAIHAVIRVVNRLR